MKKRDAFYPDVGCLAVAPISAVLNQWVVFRQILTSITGTSINTPTTVVRAAAKDKPNSIVEVAIARANRGLSEEQINLRFITLHYGKELAYIVKKF